MKLRDLFLGGAAALGLIGFAAISAAQQSPYTTNSSPEERSQTRALNDKQASDGGTAENGQSGNAADAQFNAQQRQYQSQKDEYDGQVSRYHDQLGRYEYDRRHPGDWWSARYQHASLDSFYSIPSRNLIGKEVDERDGLRIGRIRDVERASDGRVERVDVALNHDRTTWIEADNLRYDESAQVMFTNVSADELYDRSREGYNPRP